VRLLHSGLTSPWGEGIKLFTLLSDSLKYGWTLATFLMDDAGIKKEKTYRCRAAQSAVPTAIILMRVPAGAMGFVVAVVTGTVTAVVSCRAGT